MDMKFNEARDSSGKLISFKIIKNSKNLDKLRYELTCPTKNCKAKLSYLKARNKSRHSSFCRYQNDEVEYRKKQRRKLLVSLDENSVYSRLDGFKDFLYPDLKSKTNKPKSNSKRMQKTKNSVQNVKARGVASVNSKNSATNSVVSPRVSKKRLNEFILSDQEKIFQVGAKLGEITK